MTVSFGGIELDPIELAINGNAILGIKESGKSYLGTEIGEIFFDAKIPFITFDPIGIWHNMRYPGRGKGFPVVVAGGFHGDVPLTPANAPSIVEAAMKEGVSLVLDLFHPELSKADWRKIVKDCAFLLLHKNSQYGLRHIFIEEAAEFVPQTVRDGQLFDAVERVIRMGGNSQLGCTLISPRSQEVNKSVLELCETLFLFRQRGKNALENIKKWLDVAGADATNVMKTLPNMPKGECWAWLGSNEHPVHIKVPQKRSFHPDRRAVGAASAPKGSAVDVKRFVGKLEKALPEIEEAVKANDPKILKARVGELEKLLAAKTPAPDPAQERELSALRTRVGELQAKIDRDRPVLSAIMPVLEEALLKLEGVTDAAKAAERVIVGEQDRLKAVLESPTPDRTVDLDLNQMSRGPIDTAIAAGETAGPRGKTIAPPLRGRDVPYVVADEAAGYMTPARQLILDKIAWAGVFFNSPSVERVVLGFLVGKHKKTKSFVNDLGGLRAAGLIDYFVGEQVGLTEAGRAIAADPGRPTREQLLEGVRRALLPREWDILIFILAGNRRVTRQEIADHLDTHIKTKSFVIGLGHLRGLGLVYYSGQDVGAADFLLEH